MGECLIDKILSLSLEMETENTAAVVDEDGRSVVVAAAAEDDGLWLNAAIFVSSWLWTWCGQPANGN